VAIGTGSTGSANSGTPPDARDRGVLLQTIQAGKLSVEVRKYEAGQGSQSARFCDYWISHDGRPVALGQHPFQNSYNNCSALVELQANLPTLLLGAYIDSGGRYAPIVLIDTDAKAEVIIRDDCAVSSGQSDLPIKGWDTTDGMVRFCNADHATRTE